MLALPVGEELIEITHLGVGGPRCGSGEMGDGIVLEGHADRQRSELEIGNSKVVLFVGRIDVLKGIDFLIDAFARVSMNDSVLVLVGPEGGWTDEEEKYILNHGYEAVSLGGQILRAETAALCSLALISHFWNL